MMEVPLGDTYYFKFTSRQFSTGAPFTLAGTPVLSVYEENNLTQITAGVSITADYDSVTGLNEAAVVATSGNGYEVGKYYDVVITTGTVDSVSAVGEVVGQFRAVAAENNAGEKVADVASVGGTAQTANDNGADINAILADTNELQTDDVPGLIAALDSVVDTVKAETALIVADTNELQTDWANGGRLDTLLDAVALEATVAGLNDVSTADINAQVADVLKTDTVAEMSQGAPTATPTMQEILNYLYREWIRNKVVVDTNTANQKQVFADDGTTILYEKDLTNASNVTTVAEATTGA